MGPESYLLLGLAGFAHVVLGDWTTQWMTTTCTETAWSTKAAETKWNTEWSTTTCWSTEPAKPAITVTITSEYEKDFTTTQTEYSTIEKDFTTTQTEYSTVEKDFTITQTEYSTIEKDFTTTVYSSFESEFTKIETVYTTIEPPAVTKVSISTVTVTSVTVAPGKGYTSILTITPICSTPTPSLTGLVLCPSRITNTDYTPPAALPSDYLWGCKPGTICKPKQVDCNFEVDYPADTYVCSPDECITAEMPPPDNGGPYSNDYNSTCAWYEPFDSYFNLPPTEFGLTYGIFAVDGQAEGDCTPAPPPVPPPTTTTTTTSAPPPPPPAPVTTTTAEWTPWTTSSEWLPWTTSTAWLPWTPSTQTWSSYAPPPRASTSSYWSDWVKSSSEVAQYSSESTWAEWHSAPTLASTSGWKSPPRLGRRAATVPAACYKTCDNCGLQAQYVGKVYNKLCPSTAPFQEGLVGCQSCISINGGVQPVVVEKLIHQYQPFVDYCNSHNPVSAPPILGSTTTTSKPLPAPTTTMTPQPPPASTTTTTPQPPPASTTSTTSAQPPPTSSTTSSLSIVSSSTPTTASPTISTTLPSVSGITTTLCAASQISDGQLQATDCTISIATYTPPNTTIGTYSGNGAQPTQRPVAGAMVIGVVAIIAMV